MSSVESNMRQVSRWLNQRGVVGVLVSLVWIAPALCRAQSTVLSAHELFDATDWEESVENSDFSASPVEDMSSQFSSATATDPDAAFLVADDLVAADDLDAQRTPPPEPTEWIAAWIADLKQSSQRWIEVDLSEQQIRAWEGDSVVFSAPVSTGREGDWTPPGVYSIETKYDKAWMQGDDYEIPNVPYVMYFFGSYAIHGAYWRDSFGTPASRGCVSMSVDQAEWLYSWASEGTHVVIER